MSRVSILIQLIKRCIDVVVGSRMDLILSECNLYFDEDRTEDLQRLQRLLSHTDDGSVLFSRILTNRVFEEGVIEIGKLSVEQWQV